MIIRHLCFILLAFAAVTRTTFAQTDPLSCQPPQLLGMISGLNNPTSMTIDGNYAYIIEDEQTLVIIDLSNPYAPQLISRTEIPLEPCLRVDIIEQSAYLSWANNEGFTILNIEDPTDPWFVRVFTLYMDANNPFLLTPTHAVMPGLWCSVLNISRPLAPGIDDFAIPDFCFQYTPLALFGDVLWADRYFYDISDPLTPVEIKGHESYSTYNAYRNVEDQVVAITPGVGFAIFKEVSLQTDEEFNIYGTESSNPLVRDLTIRGDIQFVAEDKLRIYAAGAVPLLIGEYDSQPALDNPIAIRRLNDHFILLNQEGELAVYDIATNPAGAIGYSFTEHDNLDIDSNLAAISTSDSVLSGDAVLICDITDPAAPRVLFSLPVDFSRPVANINDGYLYVTNYSDGLMVYTIANPENPILIGVYETNVAPATGSTVWDIAIRNGLAYVIDRDSGLLIFDISDPTDLQLIAHEPIEENAYGINLQNDLAYLTSSTKLIIYDISNPVAPIRLSDIDRAEGTNFRINNATLVGELLYTAETDNGYRIFDFSDPTDPFELAHFPVLFTTPQGEFQGFPYEFYFSGNTMIIAMSSGGLGIYDNSNPFQPVLIQHFPSQVPQTGSQARYRDLSVHNGLLYTSAGQAGLRIYDLNNCALPCPADFNDDGVLNFFDVSAFIIAFTNEEPLADFNNDGQFNFFDVSEFIVAFGNGCL